MARVTKHGGRVLLIVFGDPGKVEFFQLFVAAIRTVVPDFTGPSMDPPPLPFQLQNPVRGRQEFIKAGLKEVRVESGTSTSALGSSRRLERKT